MWKFDIRSGYLFFLKIIKIIIFLSDRKKKKTDILIRWIFQKKWYPPKTGT
jgi:hypothetical protein